MWFCKVPFDSNFKKESKFLIQHLVLHNDCHINQNVARTKINLDQKTCVFQSTDDFLWKEDN